ncbi:MAG: dihydropteroate synthase [Naasia sp.]|jgi:dihydropteroate synthase|uniref:dihydropteroate synthase n=1 Tax=Naasia sp. TaxID=2546198 RepID=UPI0026047206|nr:dihydropteroate synthase [Naasia sp.]MCU1570242.1 dihydropteroate synthase [Naasia sp.]
MTPTTALSGLEARSAPEIQPYPAAEPPLTDPIRRFGTRTIDFRRHVAIMAVVNRTPDSFYDRGRTFPLATAVAAARAAVAAGAEWVDIGGQPFAPGRRLSVAEECDRVLPLVEEVRRTTDAVISVDTFEPEVAARSIRAGADVINDTSGLRDPAVAAVVAASGASLILVHSLAAPRTPFPHPTYGDVVSEVVGFLSARVDDAMKEGVPADRLLVDPGHDLNKNTLHSLQLCLRLAEVTRLGFPTVAAVSNKDFIGETLGQERQERQAGSLAAAVLCILQGARILRMHDPAAAWSAARLTESVLGWRPPVLLRHNMGEANVDAPLERTS